MFFPFLSHTQTTFSFVCFRPSLPRTAGTTWTQSCRALICWPRTMPDFLASSPGEAWEAAPEAAVRVRATRWAHRAVFLRRNFSNTSRSARWIACKIISVALYSSSPASQGRLRCARCTAKTVMHHFLFNSSFLMCFVVSSRYHSLFFSGWSAIVRTDPSVLIVRINCLLAPIPSFVLLISFTSKLAI